MAINLDNFTEEELDYIALCIIQTVHCYSLQGNSTDEMAKNYETAMQELREDSNYMAHTMIPKSQRDILYSRIERVGRENRYWE